jgi:TPR repeat protein
MKFPVLFVALLLMTSTVNAENCPLKKLSKLNYLDIECQFYLGTMAYRSKLYSAAAAHWQYVLDEQASNESEEDIKTMAQGTLNFLTYHGLGTVQDRPRAVQVWKAAAQGGNLEARRHLGYAYSDKKFINYDLIKSLAWYRSIMLLHPDPNKLDKSDREIYRDAIQEMARVAKQLSKKKQDEAEKYARTLISQDSSSHLK